MVGKRTPDAFPAVTPDQLLESQETARSAKAELAVVKLRDELREECNKRHDEVVTWRWGKLILGILAMTGILSTAMTGWSKYDAGEARATLVAVQSEQTRDKTERDALKLRVERLEKERLVSGVYEQLIAGKLGITLPASTP